MNSLKFYYYFAPYMKAYRGWAVWGGGRGTDKPAFRCHQHASRHEYRDKILIIREKIGISQI
jgi:hypothetical protein